VINRREKRNRGQISVLKELGEVGELMRERRPDKSGERAVTL
jgi:hypothetical protein